jgi:hypothetical protein
VWLINLVDPTFFHPDSFGSFSAFSGAYICGDGLLSNNVDDTFNLYNGCTMC